MSPTGAADAETKRIKEAYAERSAKSALYAWSQPYALLSQYRLGAAIARELRRAGWDDLASRRILDVGCGVGGLLRQFLHWGAKPNMLHGTELLPDRVAQARATLPPPANVALVEGWDIPFESASMDLVTASTVFSSILDAQRRSALASEMQRVVRADGLVIVYDFVVNNPRNPDVLGIGRREIARLFPKLAGRASSLTLAPPIGRPLARASPALAHVAEAALPFLRTHAIHVLRPKAVGS